MTEVVVLDPFETGSGPAVVGETIDVDASLAELMVTGNKARMVLADPTTRQRRDMPSGTWSQMQAYAAADGELWLLTDTVVRPEWWQYSASAGRWYPLTGSSHLINRVGSVATPLASITGVTAATFFGLDPMVLPAGFLAVGARLSLNAYFRRVGANATGLVRARLGTGADTSDAILVSRTMNATDGQTFWMALEAAVTASDSLLSTLTSEANNVATAGIADVTGQVDITAAMQLTLGTLSTNASDAFHCLAVAVDVDF